MRLKRPWPHRKKNLLRFFAGVLYQSQLLENKRKEQSDSCSVVFSYWPRWLFAIGCETIRLQHATLLAKLPMNADNKSWGVAWMKCKGAISCKGVQIQIRHFWEDYLHEVLPNQIETYLVKTWSTRSPPRNGVLRNNAMFLTARLALWLVGMWSKVAWTQFWNVQQVTVSAVHKLC